MSKNHQRSENLTNLLTIIQILMMFKQTNKNIFQPVIIYLIVTNKLVENCKNTIS